MASSKAKAHAHAAIVDLCTACGAPVPPHLRNCAVCGTDNECPNVRAARNTREQAALQERLRNAEISADARTCLTVLNSFGTAVLNSRAVIARSLGVVHNIVKSDNELYVPFYKQVASGARLPEVNGWDQGRTAADSTILPNYHQEISFAALSLDGKGLTAYGAYTIVLRDQAVALRASVFEENPFTFNQRHRIIAGQPVIPGYRAIWSERDILAKAKLHHLLNSKTTPDKFAGILMTQRSASGDPDFIEVHIFGNIHRRAIDRVLGPRPRSGLDNVLFKDIERALRQVGATLEIL